MASHIGALENYKDCGVVCDVGNDINKEVTVLDTVGCLAEYFFIKPRPFFPALKSSLQRRTAAQHLLLPHTSSDNNTFFFLGPSTSPSPVRPRALLLGSASTHVAIFGSS